MTDTGRSGDRRFRRSSPIASDEHRVSGQRHIVQRHTLELTLGSQREAYELMSEVRRIYYARLQGVLDEAFTRVAPPDVVVRLDRLELDLGRVHPQSLETDLSDALRRQIEEALRTLRLAGVETSLAKRPVRIPLMHSRLATMLVFLETGRLPWWGPSARDFNPTAEMHELLDAEPAAVVAALRSPTTRAVPRRLAYQFEPDVLERLSRAVDPVRAESVAATRTSWMRVLDGEPALRSLAPLALCWQVTFEALLPPAAVHGAAAFSLSLVDVMARESWMEPAELVRRLAVGVAERLPESDAVRRWIEGQTVDVAAASGARQAGEGTDTAPESTPGTEEGDGAVPSSHGSRATKPETSEVDEAPPTSQVEPGDEATPSARGRPERPPDGAAPDADAAMEGRGAGEKARVLDRSADAHHGEERLPAEETYIENAGLVLLWPFLGRFFGEIGLIRDGEFVSAQGHRRSVLVTQHLVTGDAAAPEHRLLLNKLLCGFPVEDPVEGRITLSDEESDAANVLLTSVIAQWPALKNTSVEGFREAFLRRTGRLAPHGDSWRLHVERVGYDVLLDTLPWSISVVKQPWMPQPIFVEW